MAHDLDNYFDPASVAVVGASNNPAKVGYALLSNLLFGRMSGASGGDRSVGFDGKVFAVNPKGGEILGQPVHKSLSNIGEPIEMILVAIPPKFVKGLIAEAGELGVKNAIVISAGFAEMGEEGRRAQEEMVEVASSYGMRVIGPNCLGVIRPSKRLNASFAESQPPVGGIGLLSQSGALITGVISYAQQERFGLSAAVSLGSKADVEDEDVLRWLATDDRSKMAAIYVESFPEPRNFFEAARDLAATKPVVALKGGATAAGAKAASSHTGSLAGSSAAYHAAFVQAGVLQANTIGEFINWSRALSCQPPAAGNRIAIITNAGGPGVLSADEASRNGLALVALSDVTMEALNGVLPSVWSHNNPVDVIGDATPQRYLDALNILGKADEVDGIVVIMTVQAMTDPQATAQAIANAHAESSWTKPLTCSFLGLAGSETGAFLDARGVPEFNLPESAVSAMGALVARGAWLRRSQPKSEGLPEMPTPDLQAAAAAVADGLAAGQTNLDLSRAREILAAAGITYNKSQTVDDASKAAAVAEEIDYPVVIKVVSPDVLHKSDVGGVVLNVANADQVAKACAGIRERVGAHQAGARVDGFIVEQQVSGTEIIVGMSRDPDFGPMMMVGMGGIFVEVYKDVAFRLIPLTRGDAVDMIEEITAQPLFDGARGRPRLNRGELAEILLRVSRLVEATPQIAELDINPLVITENGLVAIDARVIAK